LASVPLADQVPIDGVITGPRGYRWRPTTPATLVWVEALDGGDPKKKVPNRDRVMTLKAPFTETPGELAKTEHRFASALWGEKGGLLLLSDYDRDRRWIRTVIMNADNPSEPAKPLWSRSAQDRYGDPGAPLTRVLSSGDRAILQNGDSIYLVGTGASQEGDRPFLDRFNLKTQKAERLFRSDASQYESFVALLDDDAKQFITRHESPTAAPNYYLRTSGEAASRPPIKALTNFPD